MRKKGECVCKDEKKKMIIIGKGVGLWLQSRRIIHYIYWIYVIIIILCVYGKFERGKNATISDCLQGEEKSKMYCLKNWTAHCTVIEEMVNWL